MKAIVKTSVEHLARLINKLQDGETMCIAEDYNPDTDEARAWHTATRTRINGISSRPGVLVYYNTTSTQHALVSVDEVGATDIAAYLTDNGCYGGTYDSASDIYIEVQIG